MRDTSDSLSKTGSSAITHMDLNFKELTKNILARKGFASQQLPPMFFLKDLFSIPGQASLRKNFISQGMLCKDCHRYLARAHYSVCKICFQKRVRRFAKSGGFYVLTDRIRQRLENELRV